MFSFTLKLRIFPAMIRVAVAIIRRDGSVLVCQRKKSARYGLKWEFPGGKVEDGESESDCLKRELKEELGIEAEIGSLYHRQEYEYPDSGSFDVFYYRVRSFRGNVQNRAFESFRWIRESELQTIDMLQGNRDVVERIVNETTAP